MPGVTTPGAAGAAEAATRGYFDAEDHVVGLGWSPEGTRLAALTGSGALFILDARDARLLRTMPHAHATGGLTLDWATGGLATGGQDGKVRLWNAEGGEAMAEFDGAAGGRRTWVEQVRWSPDGRLLATAAGKTLRVWNPGAGGESCLEYAGSPSTLAAVCWRPDGKAVATGSYGGAALYRLGETAPYEEIAWKGSILSLAWSPNARYIAAGTQEATVNFWKLPYRSGDELNMSGYANKVKELAWDPASRYLATGGGSEITVWDVSGKGPRGTRPKSLQGHAKKVTLLSWQSRGPHLVSGDAAGNAALWRPERTAKPLRENGLGGVISAAVWSPDERAVAIGSGAGGVAIWNVPRGE